MSADISKGAPKSRPLYLYGCGTLFAICMLLFTASMLRQGYAYVKPDERGVVISALEPSGLRSEPLGPGLHFIVPMLEVVHIYSISPQAYTMSVATTAGQPADDDPVVTQSKDGKKVAITGSVVYSINPAEIINLHVSWQDRYQAELVRPLVRGISRDTISRYYSFDLVGFYRTKVEQDITEQLRQKFAENGLILTDFTIQDVHLIDE